MNLAEAKAHKIKLIEEYESNDIEYVNNYNYINGYPMRPKFNVNYAGEK